ncbi:hypothetical protein JOF53_002916 [Crossiella equi]|uniref:Uncharacterized protein n=1 Tax=Crossiella equi TaxID=130796 RepID=A0ABS5ABT5_9PSEU|nr:hypothetical protein [Crossiella equi]MBP2474044.1 hypothetical protein [Crossiella equi]
MSVHVSVVPDETTQVQLLIMSNGRPMLAISDSWAGVTLTVEDNPAAAAQAVLFTRELVRAVGEFAAQCDQYARNVAQQHQRQQAAELNSEGADPD